MGALSGIRVLDFTRVVAGPYCTMLLGDLGAEIVKVEQPERGDDTRSWGPPFIEGESAYFLGINRNKKSVCLDLQNEHDLEVVYQLIRTSDIVIENFRSGVMERFGLGYESWCQDYPGLIYCAISGYGRTGPYKDRAGYDVMVSALGGLMSITGTPEGAPVKTGVALTDVITGLNAFSGILAALYHRERTGQGQRIDVSLLSAELAALINAGSNYLIAGEIPEPQGSAHGSIVPYQAFRASDGYVMIGAANDKLFLHLCQALGRPEWATDERLRGSVTERVTSRKVAGIVHFDMLYIAFQADSLDGQVPTCQMETEHPLFFASRETNVSAFCAIVPSQSSDSTKNRNSIPFMNVVPATLRLVTRSVALPLCNRLSCFSSLHNHCEQQQIFGRNG